VSEIQNNWPKEEIPDNSALFLRVHKNWIAPDGGVFPGFFRNVPADDGMSCDWEKYSTAEESRNRARAPSQNGILSMVAGEIRSVPNQRLEHDPIPANRAHAQVFGDKTPEVRLKLKRIATWTLRPIADSR
jgi:hypothetical protein